MPTYEYECSNCGHVFEMFQSIMAKPKRRPDEPCASCGQKAPIRRLIGSGGAVLFKGSGFYETDYRSEGYKKAAKAESETTSTKGDAKSDGKADTSKEKSADKSKAKPADTAPKKDKGGSAPKAASKSD